MKTNTPKTKRFCLDTLLIRQWLALFRPRASLCMHSFAGADVFIPCLLQCAQHAVHLLVLAHRRRAVQHVQAGAVAPTGPTTICTFTVRAFEARQTARAVHTHALQALPLNPLHVLLAAALLHLDHAAYAHEPRVRARVAGQAAAALALEAESTTSYFSSY